MKNEGSGSLVVKVYASQAMDPYMYLFDDQVGDFSSKRGRF
jgi:hypothetical protein